MQFSERYERGGPFNTGAGGGTADYTVRCLRYFTIALEERLEASLSPHSVYIFALLFQFMMMFLMGVMLLTYPLMMMIAPIAPVFAQNLIFGVLYCWSRRFPTAQANVWGIPVPAQYLPFAHLVLRLFMGGQVFDMLHGMGVAHLYYFLADVVPQVQGREVLHTPQFLIDRLGVGEFREAAPAAPARPGFGRREAEPAAAQPRRGGGYQWGGGGQRLGRD